MEGARRLCKITPNLETSAESQEGSRGFTLCSAGLSPLPVSLSTGFKVTITQHAGGSRGRSAQPGASLPRSPHSTPGLKASLSLPEQ